MAETRLCVGVVVGAHGVRGLIKVKSFTEEPESLADYGSLSDESGARRFDLSVSGRSKDVLLARLRGVEDREAAQALRGTRLYVERDALPPLEAEDEYYQADLIGLTAVDRGGAPLGRVAAVHNFGAGDVLEIDPEARDERGRAPALLLPFTKAVVPEVDLAAGRLVIEPPAEVEARAPGAGGRRGKSAGRSGS